MEKVAECIAVRLRKELKDAGYPPENPSEKQIIPINEITSRLTRENITNLLTCSCKTHCSTRDSVHRLGVDRCVDKILGNPAHPEAPSAIKILALLILVKQSHLILDLMEHRVFDTSYEQLSEFRLRDFFQEMLPGTAKRISERKWRLNPPILVSDGMHENFHKDMIMPFAESEEPIGKGSYGNVYEVEIHPSYQRLVTVDQDGQVYPLTSPTPHLLTEQEELH